MLKEGIYVVVVVVRVLTTELVEVVCRMVVRVLSSNDSVKVVAIVKVLVIVVMTS